MQTPRRLAASVLLITGLVASSLGAWSLPGSASTKPPASAKLLELTAAQRQQLLRLYAAYRHLPVSDIARVVPGGAHGAEALPSGADWAAIMFAPSAKAPASVAVGFQDGANSGIFTRSPGSAWKAAGLGGEPLGCGSRVPAAVRQIWKLAACTAPAPDRASVRAPALVPASASAGNQVGDIARSQVGISDTPAVTSFNGLDCDPYTAVEVPSVSQSGCGKDPTFMFTDGDEFWCADFAKWVWAQAGVKKDLGVLTAAAASFYTWGKDQGETMTEDPANPAVGDAVVFYPGTAPNGSYADHVGIVTGVNSNGTVNLANGDFLGTSNISVQANNNVSLKSWSASIWGSGEDWTFVSPSVSTPTHAAAELIGAKSGKCVDTQDGAFANDTKEQLYTCNGGVGQTWTYDASGELTVDGGAYCLDVKSNGTANGTIVDLYTCNGGTNQKWTFGPGGAIVGSQSGKCLSVAGNTTTNGSQLQIFACQGTANENWSWS